MTAADAERAVDHFITAGLPSYGDYHAMPTDTPFMFHAVIALYLNAGLLDPLAVCRRVEAPTGAAPWRSTPPRALFAR